MLLILSGATHFTHWFQPQTGTTAEKHDSFLTLKTTVTNGLEEVSVYVLLCLWLLFCVTNPGHRKDSNSRLRQLMPFLVLSSCNPNLMLHHFLTVVFALLLKLVVTPFGILPGKRVAEKSFEGVVIFSRH